MSLRTLYRRYRNPLTSTDGHVLYYNWWNKQPADEIWFTNFLQKRGFLERYPKTRFVFFSSRLVFQDPVLLNTFVILATTPTAINAVLASKLYQLRTDLAVCSFILTTFLYLVVVFPLLFFLLK